MDSTARTASLGTVDAIVPCYNYGSVLADAVNSILSQESVTVRVLIIDDASTDATPTIGAALAAMDPRVEFRRHSVNIGHIQTYNEGLEWVRAAHVLLLSADDILTPGSLARAVQVMNARADVVLTYGPDLPFSTPTPPPLEPPPADSSCRIIEYLDFLETSCRLGRTPLQAPSVLVRTRTHRAMGGYRPDLPHSGDTEIWLRLASQGRVASIDAVQSYRRLHTNNMSLGYSLVSRLREQLRAFEDHLADPDCAPPDAKRYRSIVRTTIGEAAFWTAVHAFERRDRACCTEALEFAAACDPKIVSTPSWGRLQWKRRLGPRTAAVVENVYHRVRRRMAAS